MSVGETFIYDVSNGFTTALNVCGGGCEVGNMVVWRRDISSFNKEWIYPLLCKRQTGVQKLRQPIRTASLLMEH